MVTCSGVVTARESGHSPRCSQAAVPSLVALLLAELFVLTHGDLLCPGPPRAGPSPPPNARRRRATIRRSRPHGVHQRGTTAIQLGALLSPTLGVASARRARVGKGNRRPSTTCRRLANALVNDVGDSRTKNKQRVTVEPRAGAKPALPALAREQGAGRLSELLELCGTASCIFAAPSSRRKRRMYARSLRRAALELQVK